MFEIFNNSGEEVSETINRMVRGTSLEKMIETMQK